MSAYLAVHKRGLSSSDAEGSSRGDSESGTLLSWENSDKFLTARRRKLYAKSKGKVKGAQGGGRNQGHRGIARVETPDSDKPPSPSPKIRDRAARLAERVRRQISGIPKRTPDHSEDLPLVSIGETIDPAIQTQIMTTPMGRNESNVIPTLGTPLD